MLNLPRNIYVLAIVLSLNFATTSMMLLVAGLLGSKIATDPKLATLPLAMMIVGAAAASIPAALIMQTVGRKKGLVIGNLSATLGLFLAYFAAANEFFSMFVIASIMIGFNAAFIQQGRFIIMENANNDNQVADGLTLGLLANLLAAILGPALGSFGRDLVLPAGMYAGSFLLAAGALILALAILLSQYRDLPMFSKDQSQVKRNLWPIIKQPIFILAAGSAGIGYGVMAFVMTATPISMHEIDHLTLSDTTMVIQSHIVAMFLPSLLSGYLLKRGYSTSLIISGLILYILVCAIALFDQSVFHYWWALVLLGLGWNLIFITSTSILPKAYNESEKFTAQATNDFSVFTFQAIAAFAAGWILFNLSWTGVIWIALLTTCTWLASVILLEFKQT
ncbi:MFS transporter [Arenicella sp.]|nr:MFS transporter [Arenicella sp.]